MHAMSSQVVTACHLSHRRHLLGGCSNAAVASQASPGAVWKGHMCHASVIRSRCSHIESEPGRGPGIHLLISR